MITTKTTKRITPTNSTKMENKMKNKKFNSVMKNINKKTGMFFSSAVILSVLLFTSCTESTVSMLCKDQGAECGDLTYIDPYDEEGTSTFDIYCGGCQKGYKCNKFTNKCVEKNTNIDEEDDPVNPVEQDECKYGSHSCINGNSYFCGYSGDDLSWMPSQTCENGCDSSTGKCW